VLSAVLRPEQDAFGRLLMDLVSGQQVDEIVERDDGFVFASDGRYYLAPFRRWWPQERRAMRFVRGRVLDLGCGAGRVSLHLQNRGLDVVGVDVSPMAVATARRRGVADARVGTVATALTKGQLFDTILLLGNNLGTKSHKSPPERVGALHASSATAPATSLSSNAPTSREPESNERNLLGRASLSRRCRGWLSLERRGVASLDERSRPTGTTPPHDLTASATGTTAWLSGDGLDPTPAS
jgi:hypothetical protein